MIVHDAAVAWVAIIDGAVMLARITGAAVAFALCVVAFCVGPLVAPRTRERRQTAAGASESPSHGSSDAGNAPKPSSGRTRPRPRRVPSWAHTEPYTYDEAA